VHRVESTFRNPYAVQASAGVQQRVFDFTLAADYARLDGHDLMSLIDANAPVSNVKPAQRTVTAADATRPLLPTDGTFRNIVTLGNLGRSWYRALQIKAERSSRSWWMVTSYTLSRADDMANYELPEDSRNIAAERGPAAADVRHSLATALVWTLPDSASRLWNGWTVAAIGVLRSGRPYTVTWGDDRNGTTQQDARPGGRNTARTGPYRTIDAALIKQLRPAAGTLDLRVEVFNLFNATNYDQYVGALLSPFYARPVSAFAKRRVQFGAVLKF
jgi:hypothetical protein